jgi:hypothetical protein
MFGEDIPKITAKAGMKKVTGIDRKKSKVGSNIEKILSLILSIKLNMIPKITETIELIITSFEVEIIAFSTSLSETEVKKSEKISNTFGKLIIAGLNSFNKLRSIANIIGSINRPKIKFLNLGLDCFIYFFISS